MGSLIDGLVLSPDATIDLQLHTTFSDGIWSPESLIDYLVREQFDLVAVTDHDRVDSVAHIQQLAAQKNFPVLAAVEMSTLWRGIIVDVLCYGFDPENNALLELAEPVVRKQRENLQEVHAHLRRDGYSFPRQHEILAKSGGEPRQPIDFVLLLQDHGYVPDVTSAERIVDNAGFRRITTDIAMVVDAAHQSGAFCLIAHPGRGGEFPCFDPSLLDQLRSEVRIDRLDICHPSYSLQQIECYLNYVQTHQLLHSTGSDSHGYPKQMPIKYRAEISRRLLEHVGIEFR